MKGKRLLGLMLLLLSLLLCACAEEKEPEEKATPKPRAKFTITTHKCEEWLKPFVDSFNAEQEEYEIEIFVNSCYCADGHDIASMKDLLLLLEDMMAADADAICLTKEEYQFMAQIMEDDDKHSERYKDLYLLELDGRKTGFETEENVLLFVRESDAIEGVCAFVEYLEKNVK